VNVDHSTIYRWVQRYAPEMEKRLRWYWRNPLILPVAHG
jgi:IS6 family transposase